VKVIFISDFHTFNARLAVCVARRCLHLGRAAFSFATQQKCLDLLNLAEWNGTERFRYPHLRYLALESLIRAVPISQLGSCRIVPDRTNKAQILAFNALRLSEASPNALACRKISRQGSTEGPSDVSIGGANREKENPARIGDAMS
jgi:hypothetical protein